MKKIILATACGMMAGFVHAQSSVQISGVIDLGVDYAKGSQSQTRLRDGDMAASRLIFKGVEDLGGGQHAAFLLENGFHADTGAEFFGNNRLFGRQAWVELGGGWGTVRLGRQYTPTFDGLVKADAFFVNSNVSPINLVTSREGQGAAKAIYLGRFDNMIAYRSPTMGGFSATLAYAPGEAAGSSSGRNTGANLMYAKGPLYLYYAYQMQYAGTAAAPVADPTRTTFHFVGGTYTMGPVQLGLTVETDSSNAPGVNDARHYLAAVTWKINTANTLRGEVVKRAVDNSPLDPYAVTIGWDHALSKRTFLYGRAVYVNNPAGGASTINLIPINAGSGDDGRSIGFGVRHNF
ncbi:porin [Herbaspirillum sp. GCM10030257]|uniref:porin n=1 Tax=Herbaspirillum sp. GCM10030257 TaxID=3273393 RepID=UPI00360CE2CB